MSQFSPPNDSCKGRISEPHRINGFTPPGSRYQLASIIGKLSAASLVAASAGLGAVYAWTVGGEHGVILGALFVLFAVGLELAKPLAVTAAFASFRSWAVVRGAALALLAIVAIAYSLSAELSLMATARGDRVAERAATSNIAIKARDRYQRAELELDRLAVARPSAELQSLIDGVLSDPRADGCHTIDGPFTRDQCPKLVEWKSEQARAQRRAELETTMRQAERDIASGPTTLAGDPGASALGTYLAALGVVVSTDVLSRWLALVPVLALEVGSALAGVLVQALSPRRSLVAEISRPGDVNDGSEVRPVVHLVQADETGPSDERERVKAALVDHLKTKGGSVAQSERGLAALIGASRPTVRRAINGLAIAGIIAAEASRTGTALRLVA